jgi:hypothetical protein
MLEAAEDGKPRLLRRTDDFSSDSLFSPQASRQAFIRRHISTLSIIFRRCP